MLSRLLCRSCWKTFSKRDSPRQRTRYSLGSGRRRGPESLPGAGGDLKVESTITTSMLERGRKMNIIKKRREAGALCCICKSPDYKQEPPAFDGGKPNFRCNSCGHSWQYGRDGGKYAELATAP
jgi:hypothetical protein